MVDEQSLLNVLMEAVVDRLARNLIDDVADETQAGLVRAGKLQDDPTLTEINILVHPGGEDWPDELYTDQKGVRSPVYEMGGGEYWMRRFKLQLALYFDRELDRSVAREKAMVVYSRTKNLLKSMPIPDYRDDFGERAHYLQISKSYLFEGGGEGTFIWNGTIWIEFLTNQTYDYDA